MQINYKDVTIEMTPQEFNDLVKEDLIDQVMSVIVLLGMSTNEILDNELEEDIEQDMDIDLLRKMIDSIEDIDEERINSLYNNLKDITTDDDDF